MCGFIQGDRYSTVGFCIFEIPACKLLQESKGDRMGWPGKRDVKHTHSLFVDDLKVYQVNRKTLKDVGEIIVQASNDTSVWSGVAKCAEVVFEIEDGERWRFASGKWKNEDYRPWHELDWQILRSRAKPMKLRSKKCVTE